MLWTWTLFWIYAITIPPQWFYPTFISDWPLFVLANGYYLRLGHYFNTSFHMRIYNTQIFQTTGLSINKSVAQLTSTYMQTVLCWHKLMNVYKCPQDDGMADFAGSRPVNRVNMEPCSSWGLMNPRSIISPPCSWTHLRHPDCDCETGLTFVVRDKAKHAKLTRPMSRQKSSDETLSRHLALQLCWFDPAMICCFLHSQDRDDWLSC